MSRFKLTLSRVEEGENSSVEVACAWRTSFSSADPARRDPDLKVLVILDDEPGVRVLGRRLTAEDLANAREPRVAAPVEREGCRGSGLDLIGVVEVRFTW